MIYFYVLRSEKNGRLYKGHTADPQLRLRQHNKGKTRATQTAMPWQLIYSESFATREEAVNREKYFKTLKGGKELKKILSKL